MELKKKIKKLISQEKFGVFATVTQDGKPWARYVELFLSDAKDSNDDMTILFATMVDARKVEHIKHNPEVHIVCGASSATGESDYMQIQGKAIVSTDSALRHRFWRDDMSMFFSGPDDKLYAVVVVTPYRVEYTDFSTHKTECVDL